MHPEIALGTPLGCAPGGCPEHIDAPAQNDSQRCLPGHPEEQVGSLIASITVVVVATHALIASITVVVVATHALIASITVVVVATHALIASIPQELLQLLLLRRTH